jgi:hypothetical protein
VRDGKPTAVTACSGAIVRVGALSRQYPQVSEAVLKARALLAEQFGKFTLTPVSDSGRWSYSAKGSVDLFGEATLRLRGAGGPACTILPQAKFFIDFAA